MAKNKKKVLVVLLNVLIIVAFLFSWYLIHSESYLLVQKRKELWVKGRFIFDAELPKIVYQDATKDISVKGVSRVVRNLPEGFEIIYEKRQPLFSMKRGNKFLVLDDEGVVLNISNQNQDLLLVNGITSTPVTAGNKWNATEIKVAADLAALVNSNDVLKSLVKEIDISNLDGRKNKEESHVVLNTKSGCRLLWGKYEGEVELKPKEKIENLQVVLKEYKNLNNIDYVKVFAKTGPVVKERYQSGQSQ